MPHRNSRIFLQAKLAVALFLLVFYVNAWVLPEWNVITSQAQFFNLILLSVLLRADDIEVFLRERGVFRVAADGVGAGRGR